MILSRFPFPLEKGDKLRAYYQLTDLSKHFEIHLICTSEKQVSAAEMEIVGKLCKQIHVFRLKKALIGWSLLRAMAGKKPFQTSYFYQPWIQQKVNAILAEVKPDHIYCQLIRASEYVKNYHGCPKTLDYMDALSKGMERRIEHAAVPLKWLFRMESKRLAQYERQVFDYFENHTIISGQDKAHILHPKKNTITLIPNGVDHKFFEAVSMPQRYTLVFTGNMSYPPNIEAAKYIRQEIFPLLNHPEKKINCLISGANPHHSLKKLESPDFHIGGWVEDIRESYCQSDIFIAPMLIGTGLQNKLLEAMAMGLPCITTSLANNALLAAPGKEILIADTPEAFAAQIFRLMDDPAYFQSIAQAGREFVRKNYQWQAANEKLIQLLKA